MRAWVFPGVGKQRKGMAADLFPAFPQLCRRADDVLGYSIQELCRHNPERRLSRSAYSQPATFVVNALHHLAAGGGEPDYVAGHSLGEYNALHAAGAFDFETGLRLVKRRAELMGEVTGGGMAAVVGTSEAAVEELLAAPEAEGVSVANYNSPAQFVLAGSAEALAAVRPLVEARHGEDSFVPLQVGGIASHSPRMATAAEAFREVLDAADVAAPRTPVLSNVTGRPFEGDGRAVREALARQITHPVRWVDCVRFLLGAGVTEFVELGEDITLTKFIAKIREATPSSSPVPSSSPGPSSSMEATPAPSSSTEATPAPSSSPVPSSSPAVESAADDPRRSLIERIRREVVAPEAGDAALALGDDDSFRALGVDSIVYVRLARRVEAVFGVPFKPDLIYRTRTCAALADHLRGLGVGEPPPEPAREGGWREYRDERVVALVRECVEGTTSLEHVIEAIAAGPGRGT